MKVNSNIKADGLQINHNEKIASDNNRTIEEKKTIGKKLRLSKETIRELTNADLKMVAGGVPPTTNYNSCFC